MENGFLAKTREEELFAGPGSRVLVTVEVTDVTDQVLGDVPRGDGRHRALPGDRGPAQGTGRGVRAGRRATAARCAPSTAACEYHLIKALEIRDVRLVYAPARRHRQLRRRHRQLALAAPHRRLLLLPRLRRPRRQAGRLQRGERPVPAAAPPEGRHRRSGAGRLRHGRRLPGPDQPLPAGRRGRRTSSTGTTRRASGCCWKCWTIIEEQTAERPDAAIKYAGFVAGINNSTKNYEGMLSGFAKSDMLRAQAGPGGRAARLGRRGRRGSGAGYVARPGRRWKRWSPSDQRTRERDLYRGMIGPQLDVQRGAHALPAEPGEAEAGRPAGARLPATRPAADRGAPRAAAADLRPGGGPGDPAPPAPRLRRDPRRPAPSRPRRVVRHRGERRGRGPGSTSC